MKQTDSKSEKSHAAAKQAGKALEAGFGEVKTPSQASDVLDKVDSAASDIKERDFAPGQGSVDPIKQAEAVNEAAAAASPKERAAAVAIHAAGVSFSQLRFSLHSHAFIWARITPAMYLAEAWPAPRWPNFIEAY